jgi:hypothetical protein
MGANIADFIALKGPGALDAVSAGDAVDLRELKLLVASRWPEADFTRLILALPDQVSGAAYPEIAAAIVLAVRRERGGR